MKKILTTLLLIIVLGVPAIHKITGPYPPDWFLNKFVDSIINQIPFGLKLSYTIIVLLEIAGPLLFIIGLLKKEHTENADVKYINYGFYVCYTLFIILTFGSFLIEDYSNGFKDFTYFIGIVIIDQLIWSTKKS